MASNATIVAIVNKDTVGDFQRNWLSWRFPPGTPILLVFVGVSRNRLWLAGAKNVVESVKLPYERLDNLPSLLRTFAESSRTNRVILLPAPAAALPGAHLWAAPEWAKTDFVVHTTEAARDEENVTGNRFLPQFVFGMFSTRMLRKIAELPEAKALAYSEFPILIRLASERYRDASQWADLGRQGWQLPPMHVYWSRIANDNTLKAATASRHTKLILRQGKRKGAEAPCRHVADDVVVISLPERTDRRTAVQEMMARERVVFRFVDGVRVRTSDIRREEVAEVGWRGFKLAAGRGRYLRGMVGCMRAHIHCLESALNTGRHSILIMEDDAILVDRWYETFTAARSELPVGWLQLYLSAGSFRPSVQVSPHLHRLSGACQTTAILYSKDGIEAGLACCRNARNEVDFWMALHLHPFGCSYSVHPQVTWQKGGYSDILSYQKEVTS